MSYRLRTPSELRRAGLKALVDALGPVDAVRFMQQFESGDGDYTAERHKILGNPSLDDVLHELADRAKGSQGPNGEHQ